MELSQREAMLLELAIIWKALSIVRDKRVTYSGTVDPYRNLRSCSTHGVEPWRGVLVRLEDKLARSRTIAEAKNEWKLLDLLNNDWPDAVNYLSIHAGLVVEELVILRQEFIEDLEDMVRCLPELVAMLVDDVLEEQAVAAHEVPDPL